MIWGEKWYKGDWLEGWGERNKTGDCENKAGW